jgi:hypothetical protein
MLTRSLKAVQSAVQRHGVLGTLRRGGKLVAFLRDRLRDASYYRNFQAREEAEGFDRKYGTETSQIIETFEMGLQGPNASGAVRYAPAHVNDVLRGLDALKIDHSSFTFVDLGSGKARTLMVASRFPYKKLIGVEFSERLHQIAQENVRKFKAAGEPGEFDLLCQDATTFEPPNTDLVYYMFNPFGAPVLEAVMRRLSDSLSARPRKAALLYIYPLQAQVIEGTGIFRLTHRDERFNLYTNW